MALINKKPLKKNPAKKKAVKKNPSKKGKYGINDIDIYDVITTAEGTGIVKAFGDRDWVNYQIKGNDDISLVRAGRIIKRTRPRKQTTKEQKVDKVVGLIASKAELAKELAKSIHVREALKLPQNGTVKIVKVKPSGITMADRSNHKVKIYIDGKLKKEMSLPDFDEKMATRKNPAKRKVAKKNPAKKKSTVRRKPVQAVKSKRAKPANKGAVIVALKGLKANGDYKSLVYFNGLIPKNRSAGKSWTPFENTITKAVIYPTADAALKIAKEIAKFKKDTRLIAVSRNATPAHMEKVFREGGFNKIKKR